MFKVMGLFDPYEAYLSAKIEAISYMGKKGVRMAGGAESKVRLVCHCVIVDVLREEAASLQ